MPLDSSNSPRDVGADRLRILVDRLDRDRPALDMFRWDRCACGFATTIPALREQGLHLIPNDVGALKPAFDGRTGMDAVCAFFGLTRDDGIALFSVIGHPAWEWGDTGAIVARMRKHLAARAERVLLG